MGFDKTPLREYYFLNRESFSLDPWKDRNIFFGDSTLEERIGARIQRDFLEPRGVPKFFVHGSFGSGKTHTLYHIAYLLEQEIADMYPTAPIYLDIAPLSSKERWVRIHARLLDAIGLDRVREAAEGAVDSIKDKDKVEGLLTAGILAFGDEALKKSQAEVFRNLLFGGKQMHQSWEWMKGRKASVDEAQTLGTQKNLEEPQDFVHCLLNLGTLFYHGTGKKMVFLVDEAEAFRFITNPDCETEIRHAIRMLLENSNTYVGFVFAFQAESGQEVGPIFTRDDIMRRVGYEQGFFDLNGLLGGVKDTENFIKETLAYVVDSGKAAAVVKGEKLKTNAALFPFTEGAVEAIETHIHDTPERKLPAAILSYISNAAIEAWRLRAGSDVHVLVDESIVEEAIFPGESVL